MPEYGPKIRGPFIRLYEGVCFSGKPKYVDSASEVDIGFWARDTVVR